MYIPPAFAVDGEAEIAAFVERAAAADLVTFDGSQLVASLLPVIWERPEEAGEHGRLLAHMALNNPQWSTAEAGVSALAIVHGPQAYISPAWYESKREHGRVVPTWNYTSVHFTGPVRFHRDPEWIRDVVTRLTDRHETGRRESGADRWRVTDAPERFVDGQLQAIVGVELTVTRVEAKAKLSQNRPDADRIGVIEALRAELEPGAGEVAELMTERELARKEAGRPGAGR